MPLMPPFIAPTFHSDPASALAQVRTIYGQQINHLREAMQRLHARFFAATGVEAVPA